MNLKVCVCVQGWELSESWEHCIDYLGTREAGRERGAEGKPLHCYRVQWSEPTRRKPVPMATASVYFFLQEQLKVQVWAKQYMYCPYPLTIHPLTTHPLTFHPLTESCAGILCPGEPATGTQVGGLTGACGESCVFVYHLYTLVAVSVIIKEFLHPYHYQTHTQHTHTHTHTQAWQNNLPGSVATKNYSTQALSVANQPTVVSY